MRISTILEHSEDGLNLILEKACAFERERVLEGIYQRKYNVYEIEQMVVCVQEYHAKMRREINSIVAFSRDFNRKFTTDNNECFEIAERLFRKIRSSVSGTKKIFRNFCKRMRSKYPGHEAVRSASVFTHSILASGVYSKDMYGESYFPKAVQRLCDELESFFNDLVQIILVCKNVTAEEAMIRNDIKRLKELYESDCNLMRTQQKDTLSALMEQKTVLHIDPMTKCKKSRSLQAFLVESFHRFSTSNFALHTLYETLEAGRKVGCDDLESVLWKDHLDFVPKVRLLIDHFDELEPAGRFDHKQNKYKLSGEFMARFVKWCCLEGKGHEATFIEVYFKQHYHGECIIINANTVNIAKNKITRNNSVDPKFTQFVQKIENLLNKYEGNGSKVLPLAANY